MENPISSGGFPHLCALILQGQCIPIIIRFSENQKESKNLLAKGDKSEQLVLGLAQLFELYEVENLHTCQSQHSIEGGLIGGSLMILL